MKVVLAVIFSLITGLFPNTAKAQEIESVPVITYDQLPEIKLMTAEDFTVQSKVVQSKVTKVTVQSKVTKGSSSTRASNTIPVDRLEAYLSGIGSPLAPYSAQILESPHWSTIIGICTIEQYNCTRAPGNNYWGIMKRGGGLERYASLPDGISAISNLLVRYESRGKDTLEKLNGYYVVPASQNWYNTVLKIKLKVEEL